MNPPLRTDKIPGLWLALTLVMVFIGVAMWMAWHRTVRLDHVGAQPPASPWPDMRLNLNTATAGELASLPGIGPARAEQIVADRQARGPFLTINDLDRVGGIGAKTIERIAPYLVADPPNQSTPKSDTP